MSKCIVVYDDDMSCCCPMTADTDCEGAIGCGSGTVLVFADRKSARDAIKITKLFAELQRAQGKGYNSDFIETIRHIKIRPIVEQPTDTVGAK